MSEKKTTVIQCRRKPKEGVKVQLTLDEKSFNRIKSYATAANRKAKDVMEDVIENFGFGLQEDARVEERLKDD